MVTPLTKQLLDQQAKPVSLVPCTVTSTSPLTVSMLGGTYPGVSVSGCTYTVGAAAIALLTSPGKPVILPIGA